MRSYITIACLLFSSITFSQWILEKQLPFTDITTLYKKDSMLYAGGKSIVYFSSDKGVSWDSTNQIPQFGPVHNIVVFKNELYAASFSLGVSKSIDRGIHWQKLNDGVLPDVSGFAEWNGDLYASTFGTAILKLEPGRRSKWELFDNGLSNQSANATAIVSTSNALVAGTLANGLYDLFNDNANSWEERFLLNKIDPNEGTFQILNSHDSLFLAGRTGKFYKSTDQGKSWTIFGNRLPSPATSLANAKQAIIISTGIFNGVNNVLFHYIKKDALAGDFTRFSVVENHFTYKIEIFAGKVWDASTEGLFSMSLAELPGITDLADSIQIIALPLDFIALNASCQGANVLVRWKTAGEQNSRDYTIERSIDGTSWAVIALLPATGKRATETSYSFTDKNPLRTGYYRIVETATDGKKQLSKVINTSCKIADVITAWPNPVKDELTIRIVTAIETLSVLKIYDGEGALVKRSKLDLKKGENKYQVNLNALSAGIYHLIIERNDLEEKSTFQLLKR